VTALPVLTSLLFSYNVPPRPCLSAAIHRTVIWISLACRLLAIPVPKVRYTSHNRLYDASGWHSYWLLHFRQDLILLVLRVSNWGKSRTPFLWDVTLGYWMGCSPTFRKNVHQGVKRTKSNRSHGNEDSAFFRNVGKLSTNNSASHFVTPKS